MGTIVVTTNLTLDGVVQDPDGQEGTRGGWFGQFGGADLDVWTKMQTDETLGADALLLGGAATSGSPHAGRPAPGSGPTA